INLGYREMVYLDLTGRKEWSSTVQDSYFYPSAGLSYILTKSIGKSDFLSFLKLRASYAEVGNDLPFGVSNLHPNFSVNVDRSINPPSTLPFFEGTDTTYLKPERSKSFEVGTDLRLF